MFRALACFLVAFVVATNAQHTNNAATNTAMNVMSSGSSVVQNDVQNVNDGAGWRHHHHGYAGYHGYPGYAGGYAYHPGFYGYDAAPIAYGHGGYGAAPIGLAAPHHYGYAADYYGYPGHVNSASSNTGANIASVHSDVYQHHIQNVNKY